MSKPAERERERERERESVCVCACVNFATRCGQLLLKTNDKKKKNRNAHLLLSL